MIAQINVVSRGRHHSAVKYRRGLSFWKSGRRPTDIETRDIKLEIILVPRPLLSAIKAHTSESPER